MKIQSVAWAFDQVVHDMHMRLVRQMYADWLPGVRWWRGHQLGRYRTAPYWDDVQ